MSFHDFKIEYSFVSVGPEDLLQHFVQSALRGASPVDRPGDSDLGDREGTRDPGHRVARDGQHPEHGGHPQTGHWTRGHQDQEVRESRRPGRCLDLGQKTQT